MSVTDKPKTPEFNLRKKPEPSKRPSFGINEKLGVIEIEMRSGGTVVTLGGLNTRDLQDLTALMLNHTGGAAMRELQAMRDPRANCDGQYLGLFGQIRPGGLF